MNCTPLRLVDLSKPPEILNRVLYPAPDLLDCWLLLMFCGLVPSLNLFSLLNLDLSLLWPFLLLEFTFKVEAIFKISCGTSISLSSNIFINSLETSASLLVK
eukprot:NODE_610_length_6054_cov_0.409908.p5 type:complete len:102 gc:universal NODE_610_length_6054_cov_0.409908:3072-2767(-)